MRVRRNLCANVDGRVQCGLQTCNLQVNRREIAGRRRVTTLVEIADRGDPDLRFPTQLKIDDHSRRSIVGGSGLDGRRTMDLGRPRVEPGTRPGKAAPAGCGKAVRSRKGHSTAQNCHTELITQRDHGSAVHHTHREAGRGRHPPTGDRRPATRPTAEKASTPDRGERRAVRSGGSR